MKNNPTIGCVVITHNAKHHLPNCLPPLLKSPLQPRVLVVNSSSNDGTVEMAQQLGAETLVIPRKDFNHGTTRELARQHLKTDIVVMITPDAYLANEHMLEKLLNPIINGKSAVSYARQIPHKGAGFFESFPRDYNYPSTSHIRGIEDQPTYGVYTFFCSDSCAAYSNKVLNEIGGFPSVLLGEDTVAVAKILRKGYKIAYVAEAVTAHSHSYSLWHEFRRCFDIGLARKGYSELLACNSSDSKRGMGYFQEMIKRLIRQSPKHLPYAFAHVFVKWLGYSIGKRSEHAPVRLKKALSSQDFYWTSNAFLKGRK